MSIFKNAYFTTTGAGYDISKIVEGLETLAVSSDTETTENECVFVVTPNHADTIPLFMHPIEVRVRSKGQDTSFMMVDERPFTRVDKHTKNVTISNEKEYYLHLYRGSLNVVLNETPRKLRDFSSIPAEIYNLWISSSISKLFGLDKGDELKLLCLSSFFYYSLFDEDSHNVQSDNDYRNKLKIFAQKTTYVPPSLIESLSTQYTYSPDIISWCETVKTILQNPQLDDFNSGVLVTCVMNSWFGLYSREMCACALEHIPTWISLVLAACTDRSYKNTPITRLVDSYAKRKGVDLFIRSVRTMADSIEVK